MLYTSFEQLPLTITVEKLADILDIGMNTAYAVARSGAIKTIRVGNQIRIPKQALIDYLGATA